MQRFLLVDDDLTMEGLRILYKRNTLAIKKAIKD